MVHTNTKTCGTSVLGFYPMKIDGALETMVVDPRHDTLVLGKTEEQLVRKFGYVLPITQAHQLTSTATRPRLIGAVGSDSQTFELDGAHGKRVRQRPDPA